MFEGVPSVVQCKDSCIVRVVVVLRAFGFRAISLAHHSARWTARLKRVFALRLFSILN